MLSFSSLPLYYYACPLFLSTLCSQKTATHLPLPGSPLFSREVLSIETDSSVYEIQEFIRPSTSSPFFEVESTSSSFGEIVLASLDGVYYFDGHRLCASSIPSKHIKQYLGQILTLEGHWLCLVNEVTDSIGFISDLLFFNEKTQVSGSLADYCHACRSLQSTPIIEIQKISQKSLFVQTRGNQYFILSQDGVKPLALNKEYHYVGPWNESAVLIRNTKNTTEFLLVDDDGEKTRPTPSLPSSFRAGSIQAADSVLYFSMHELLGRKMYSIDLKRDSLFSADWKVHHIPSHLIFRFSTNRGLLFNESRQARDTLLTHAGLTKSAFSKKLKARGIDSKPFAKVNTNACLKNTTLLATERGLIRIYEKEKSPKSSPFLRSKTGFSSRQMALSPDKRSIWLTSYNGTFHLDLQNFPDTLPELPIPKSLRSYLNTVTYNTKSTKDGSVFLSDYHIIVYSKAKDTCFLYPNPSPDKRILFGLEETQQGHFLIGTTQGVFLLPSGQWEDGLTPVSLINEAADTAKASTFLYTHRIKRLSQTDSLFVCTRDGLYFCLFVDEPEPKLKVLKHLSYTDVHDAHLLEDGTLLLATEHEGLLWLDATKERKVKYRFDKSNHLQSNYTHNILQDSKRRIWLSSKSGLYLIDLKKKNIRTFGEKDGFPSDEFNRVSSLCIADSLFVFGGINGVTFFDPNDYSTDIKQKNIGRVS